MVRSEAADEVRGYGFVVKAAKLRGFGVTNNQVGAVKEGLDELANASNPARCLRNYLVVCEVSEDVLAGLFPPCVKSIRMDVCEQVLFGDAVDVQEAAFGFGDREEGVNRGVGGKALGSVVRCVDIDV